MDMTDIEIEKEYTIQNIKDIASKIDVDEDHLEYYGRYKAKLKDIDVDRKSKLILVTATNPTPYGEGKTTVSIGLVDGLNKLGYKAIATLREPSLGPVFGVKGGATGGGYSQIAPMEDINLHFTGDMHAITCANNLLCAAIDNHIFHGNALQIDKESILVNRCLDINDRALRNVTLENRKEHFIITAASEIMAILCLSKDLDDLKKNLENILIAKTIDKKPVYAKDLNIVGSLMVILKDAMMPNLVQTLENNPVIIHGGPFANIAHGCSSIKALNDAMTLSDYTITEAGFGADLGAEKFYDIKCPRAGVKVDCTVLVTTIRSLKYNGNGNLEAGLSNLEVHMENLKKFGNNIIVCLNKYETDTEEEIKLVEDYTMNHNCDFSVSEAYLKGSKGILELSKKVVELSDKPNDFHSLYSANISIYEKIETLAKEIYRANNIQYEPKAKEKIKYIESLNRGHLPICVAKTQYSISDDKNKLGKPINTTITVTDVKLYNGAGFITIYLGKVNTMPGLQEHPNYENIGLDENGEIEGIF